MNGVFTQSAAQNDTCGVVILNAVKDLVFETKSLLIRDDANRDILSNLFQPFSSMQPLRQHKILGGLNCCAGQIVAINTETLKCDPSEITRDVIQ